MKAFFLAALLSAPLSAAPAAKVYQIDASHSSVSFRIAHMVVGRVRGSFNDFSGSVTYAKGDPKEWAVEAVIQAASIDTGNDKRDGHLRNPDFFDVEKYPVIEFKSAKAVAGKNGKAKLHGNLTMHGVTKPVVLDLEIGGVAADRSGGSRLGASASGRINRKEFGLSWHKVMEGGGLMVGDEVEILLDVEAVSKP